MSEKMEKKFSIMPAALSWRTKLASLLLFFSLAPAVVVAAWAYEILVSTFETATLSGLQALAKAKAEAIDQFTDFRRRDVEGVASLMAADLDRFLELEAELAQSEKPAPEESLPKLKDAEEFDGRQKDPTAKPPPATPPPKVDESDRPPPAPENRKQKAVDEAFAALKQKLGLILWDQRDFEELLLIDSNGRVVAATFEGHEGKTAEALEYFMHGRKGTYVQPVFLSPITEELTMVIATPIRDESLREIGVVAARLNLSRFFRLINDTTGLGETGETVVAKKIADNLVFMAPTRHDAQAALERTIPIGSEIARPLQEAARGQSGASLQMDYRAVPTFAAWQFVPSLEWGLLVKIDQSEAVRGALRAREQMIFLMVVLLLLIVPTSLAAARALVRPLRELKDATDRISRGDLAVQLDIRSRDEIGELADSFERMVAAIKFFRERSRPDEEEPPEDDERAAPIEGH